jgi:hypothetical protein
MKLNMVFKFHSKTINNLLLRDVFIMISIETLKKVLITIFINKMIKNMITV